ncbi:hypothetical protein THRCLA_04504, partial [Thraustotheca clavata]
CYLGLIGLNPSVYLFVLLTACLCGILAYTGTLIFIYYGENTLILQSRPIFSHLINFGTMLGATSVAVAVSLHQNSWCTVLWCTMDIAFVLVFGTIGLRLYRNMRLFFASTNSPQVKFTDRWIAIMLASLITLETIILAAVSLFNGFTRELKIWEYPDHSLYQFEGCYLTSEKTGIVLVAPKFIYLLANLYFAVKLRKCPREERDMTKMSFCLLLCTMLWIVGWVVFASSVGSFAEVFYLCLIFMFVLPCTMVGFVLVFPKLVEIHRHFRSNRYQLHIHQDDVDINGLLFSVAWDDVEQVEAAEIMLEGYCSQLQNDQFSSDNTEDGHYVQLSIGTLLLLFSDRVCHRRIRRLAAMALTQLDYKEVLLYLPQLLQALKYDIDLREGTPSPLLEYLFSLAEEHLDIATGMYWHVAIELKNQIPVLIEDQEVVLCDRETKPLYYMVEQRLVNQLEANSDFGSLLKSQSEYIQQVQKLYHWIITHSNDVKSMSLELKNILSGQSKYMLPMTTFPCPHPLYPTKFIRGMDPNESFLFKSSARPMKLQLLPDEPQQLAYLSKKIRLTFQRSSSQSHHTVYTYTVLVHIYRVDGFALWPVVVRAEVHGKRNQTLPSQDNTWIGDSGQLEFKVGVPPRLVECQVFRGSICLGAVDIELNSHGFNRATVPMHGKGSIELAVDVIPKEITSPPMAGALHLSQSNLSNTMTERLLHAHNSISTAVIYKLGDDLRQDQLALQLLAIMDNILKQNGLDLEFTLYQVLPTSISDGWAEFVPNSRPMSAVLAQNNHNIVEFLQRYNLDMDDDDNIAPVAKENFVRSVAGYCVATYILGVGDRHLDNLMMRESGHFFHIDFGFMFGRDPKPLPPPFRLTPEMVRAMGGLRGQNFLQCIRYACSCFNILRKHAHVLLGVLELTKDAGIPDMWQQLTMSAESAIRDVERRLILHASDEKAADFMKDLMLETQNTKTKTRLSLMERIHRIAVAMK